MNVENSSRIEYIDALRGFTMLLVVTNHIAINTLGIGPDCFSINTVFSEFRMPLFFFVSGFFVYKIGNADLKEQLLFLIRKTKIQLFSPFLFLAVSAYIQKHTLIDVLFFDWKIGYWFTFTLFEYFVIYLLCIGLCKCIRISKIEDLFLIIVGLVFFIGTIYSFVCKFNMDKGYSALFGIPTFHYFLFFVLGSRAKKYFYLFEKMLEKEFILIASICLFLSLNMFDCLINVSDTLTKLVASLTGIIIVFAFFRKNKHVFTKQTTLGRWSQYLGKRTLDVYLLHSFFLYSNMNRVFPDFSVLNSPFIEFLVSLLLGIVVVLCSLLVSKILEISPALHKFLFGK